MKINEIVTPKAKIDSVKPNNSATIDNGDGTKTVVDLRKNPGALTKDEKGNVKLNKPAQSNTSGTPGTNRIKPGQKVVTDET